MKKTAALTLLALGLIFISPDLSAQNSSKILMYGSKNCGLCKSMQNNLDRENIPYTFYDVKEDRSKNSEMWTKIYKDHGRMNSVRFPVMDINGKILVSPKFEDVKKLISSTTTPADKTDKPAAEKKPDYVKHNDVIIYEHTSSPEVKNICGALIDSGTNFKYVNLTSSPAERTDLMNKIKVQHPDLQNLKLPIVDVKGKILIAPTAAEVKNTLSGNTSQPKEKAADKKNKYTPYLKKKFKQ